MKKVDAFLSRRVQVFWPDAVVYIGDREGRRTYWIERGYGSGYGQAVEIELGNTFGEAKASIMVLSRKEMRS